MPTPITDPVATLRQAADKLRQLATADGITPGPWEATPRYRKGTQTVVQYDVVKPPRPGSNTPQRMVRRPEDAADVLYGVAMHPGVGLALAEMLETEAAIAEDMQRHSPEMTSEHLAVLVDGPLAIANALLGKPRRSGPRTSSPPAPPRR